MIDSKPPIAKPRSLIEAEEFTPQKFEMFLLNTIFTEVLWCDVNPDAMQKTRQLLTAVGKLQNQWYLVQISSQEASFENVRIIQLPSNLLTQLGALL